MPEALKKITVCAAEPFHYCRVDRKEVEGLLDRIAACEAENNWRGALIAYIRLGNVFIGGCPAVRVYGRESMKIDKQANSDISKELIGMHLFAQYICKVNFWTDIGVEQTALEATLGKIAASLKKWDRDGAVKCYIELGGLCAAILSGGNEVFAKIAQEDIAEEIGLHVFIMCRFHTRFMPEPGERMVLCGTNHCVLSLCSSGLM